MTRFAGDLVLTLLEQGDRPQVRDGRSLWRLERDLTYRTLAGDTITVPQGFITDLTSVPRLFWDLFPPDGPWTEAAVVHDALYFTRGGLELWRGRRVISRATPYSRAESDAVLREAMADIGVGVAPRILIWAAVRIGGTNAFGT
ncbi:MAG: DUF1353 domain-containing protein [Proteobacteria bacterium]|nr:DUF1353 domain-containing protein [Pseudomonadota bacterium]